jgi:hypothetical protein
MSYGNTLQTRLGLDFDITKFGTAIDPFGDLEDRLSKQSNIIRDNTATVYTAIADSVVSTSTYFQNPVAGVVSSLTNVINSLYTTIWNYNVPIDDGEGGSIPNYILRPTAVGMDTSYASLTQELTVDDSNANGTPKAFETFISHTDRLSNLKQSNKSSRPSFSSAQTLMQSVQTLIYQTETTSTSTVGALGLGVFTSLFIVPDLTSYWSTLTNNLSVVTGLLVSNPISVTPAITAAVNSATNNFTNLLSLLTTRRTHDANFYQNAISISQDLNKISANKNTASTSSAVSNYLVDNLIGTTALKNL